MKFRATKAPLLKAYWGLWPERYKWFTARSGNSQRFCSAVGRAVHHTHLSRRLQLLLHVFGRSVHVDDQVRGQKLADTDVLDLVVMIHTCRPDGETLWGTTHSPWAASASSVKRHTDLLARWIPTLRHLIGAITHTQKNMHAHYNNKNICIKPGLLRYFYKHVIGDSVVVDHLA